MWTIPVCWPTTFASSSPLYPWQSRSALSLQGILSHHTPYSCRALKCALDGLQDYVKAVRSFKLKEAFPNMESHPYDWRVDPYEPQRVWFTIRSTAKHTGPLNFAGATYKATNKVSACDTSSRPATPGPKMVQLSCASIEGFCLPRSEHESAGVGLLTRT